MERFPVLKKAELDGDQRKLWDELTLGPRGFYTGGAEAERLPDLYNAWLQFPEFGELMLRLGDAIRAKSELPGRLRELVVLTMTVEEGIKMVVSGGMVTPEDRRTAEERATPKVPALPERRPGEQDAAE